MQPIKNIAISISDMNKIKKGCMIKRGVIISIAIVGSILGVKLCSMLGVKACSGNDKEGMAKTNEAIGKDMATVDTALVSRLKDFAAMQRPEGKFAFHVYDITADKVVYGCNDTLALPSASCMKLLAGVAGLKQLGAN